MKALPTVDDLRRRLISDGPDNTPAVMLGDEMKALIMKEHPKEAWDMLIEEAKDLLAEALRITRYSRKYVPKPKTQTRLEFGVGDPEAGEEHV